MRQDTSQSWRMHTCIGINVSYKHVIGRKINTGWNLAACHQIEEIIIFSDGDFEVDIYELS